MPRRHSGVEGEENPLNLAPFMNMVIILIPLLLTSIIFLKIGVINITAPELASGPKTEQKEKDEEKPLNLTVAVSKKGFRIAAKDATLSPVDGCPEDGPTICLKDDSVKLKEKFQQATELMRKGDADEGAKQMDKALSHYDWRRLYNKLSKIKSKHPDEKVINLTADPDIPYAAIVRVMDTARYKLTEDAYDSTQEFTKAQYKKSKTEGTRYEALFNQPVINVVK